MDYAISDSELHRHAQRHKLAFVCWVGVACNLKGPRKVECWYWSFLQDHWDSIRCVKEGF